MKWSPEAVAQLINREGFMPGPLEIDAVKAMVARGNYNKFDAHQFVTRKGDEHPRLCIVLSGHVRLTAFTEDGKEMLSHFILPGDCWGVHPCLGDYTETNDGITEVPSEVLSISAIDVDELMWTYKSFQNAMVKVLCSRLNLAVQVASQLGVHNSAQRLAWRLDMLAKNVRSVNASTIIAVSQESLASMIGLTRQRTNFLLRALEKSGVIALNYNKIEVLDAKRLQQLASQVN